MFINIQIDSSVRMGSCWHADIVLFKRNFLIEIYLIFNVVLVLGVQQSDSVLYIYIFSDSFPL